MIGPESVISIGGQVSRASFEAFAIKSTEYDAADGVGATRIVPRLVQHSSGTREQHSQDVSMARRPFISKCQRSSRANVYLICVSE